MLIVIVPVTAFMWGDLQVAIQRADAVTERALIEARKLKELRLQILKERSTETIGRD
jgi:hypothetical protein